MCVLGHAKHGDPLLGKEKRGGQPAEPSTDDEHLNLYIFHEKYLRHREVQRAR
jgi:hypothetical protein